MKITLFLPVLIGIATVGNSEASKERIKKDVSFDESQRTSVDVLRGGGNVEEEHVVGKDSKRLGWVSGGDEMDYGILDQLAEIFGGLPVNVPGGSMVTVEGLLENLLKNFNPAKFINCTLNQLQSNMDKCFRGLLLHGFNISSVYFNINALLFGSKGREDECTSCGRQDLDTQLSILQDLCPVVANLTYYLGCIIKETSKLSCINYNIGPRLQEVVYCLGVYVEEVSSGKTSYNCSLLGDNIRGLLTVVLNLVDGFLGDTSNQMISPSIREHECHKLSL